MIKEFCLLFSSLSCLSVPSIQNDRQYQHTENVGNTEVTYQYETNDVTSFDDLVVGNLYKYTVGNSTEFNCFSTNFYRITYDNTTQDASLSSEIYSSGDSFRLRYVKNDYIQLSVFTDNTQVFVYFTDRTVTNFEYFYFVYVGNYSTLSLSSISKSDFNIVESVEYVPPSTVVGVINEFCEDYLFSEIPYVNEISFTVGGQQISLMTYLVIFVGISLGVVILVLLFYLFKWLFWLFANIFKPR